MKRYSIALLAVLCLAGCADTQKDYTAMNECSDLGLDPATEDYKACVTEHRNKRLMEQQRKEYEQMKQYERDWKLRRY